MEVLQQFGRQRKHAIQGYRQFIERGIRDGVEDLSGGGLIRSYQGWEHIKALRKEHEIRIGDERILGTDSFVERTLQSDELQWEAKSRLPARGWNLEKLIKYLCEKYAVDPGQLQNRGRENPLALVKSLLCYWGGEAIGETASSIGKRLGMSQPAVSKAKRKGQAYCEQHGLEWESELSRAKL